MKILLSAYACEPNKGTEEGFGWNWSTHLAESGVEVWVLTRTWAKDAIEAWLKENAVKNLHFVFVDVPDWTKPALKGIFGVYTHYFLWQRAAYREAKNLLEDHDFALSHHVTWGSLIGGSWLWKLPIPFIFGPVGGGQVAPAAFKAYFPTRWKQESLRTWVTQRILPSFRPTRRMLNNTALLLATNTETLHVARQLGVKQGELFLDTGLPGDYFVDSPRTGFQGETLRILWVGRLLERKALRLALQALARTPVSFKLTILGTGPQDELVNQWIKELNLEGKVDWPGRVPWHVVQELYQQNDVFLFTSLRDSFGSQLMEAMANGLPIITLNHQGGADFVPDTAGHKVAVSTPEKTIEALAQAITRFNENRSAMPAMSQAGLAFAKENEWSQKVNKVRVLYDQILGPKTKASKEKVSIS